MWLNSASSVRYPVAFTGNERNVEITGEAYFEIAHDATKPFKVIAAGMETEVLGTRFNINSYKDEAMIRTTLLEGRIKVGNRQSSIVNNKSVILKPGQQAQLAANTGLFEINNNVDIEQAIAWKYGFFQFDNDDLYTVMRQLARWYDVEVIYQGGVGPDTYGGRINRNSKVSEVLTLLERTRVHFKIDGKKIIVTR